MKNFTSIAVYSLSLPGKSEFTYKMVRGIKTPASQGDELFCEKAAFGISFRHLVTSTLYVGRARLILSRR